jgi:predicted nucleic acid-binding protein
MTILDAQALIAFLRGEPAAPDVAIELRRRDTGSGISAVNLAEVIDRLLRVYQLPDRDVTRALELVFSDGVSVLPADEPTGQRAGRLRARYYDARTSAISLADCIALATCRRPDDSLATSDPALAGMARAEGVPVVALPDSQGRRP